jgi:cystathionine beta-lyase family protein involved in aluminum resistance
LALSEPAVIKNEEHVTRSQNDLVNSEFIKMCIKGSPPKGGYVSGDKEEFVENSKRYCRTNPPLGGQGGKTQDKS